jgi:hypothetical protein
MQRPVIEQGAGRRADLDGAAARAVEGDRRKAREDPEHQGEKLPFLQPALAAEHKHGGPCQRGIAEKSPRKVGRNIATAPDQLHPCERYEERKGRPHAKPCRIGASGIPSRFFEACIKRQILANAPICPTRRPERRIPWIEELPDIPEHRRKERDADPADDPDHGRSNVPEGILLAEEATEHDGQKCDERQQPHHKHERAGRDLPAAAEVTAKMRQRPRRSLAGKEASKDYERESDDGASAPEIERERDG